MSFENRICLSWDYCQKKKDTLAAIGKTLLEECVDTIIMSEIMNADMSITRDDCRAMLIVYPCRMCFADGAINLQEIAYLSVLYPEVENEAIAKAYADQCDEEMIDMISFFAEHSQKVSRNIARITAIAAAIDGSYDLDSTFKNVYLNEAESAFLYHIIYK